MSEYEQRSDRFTAIEDQYAGYTVYDRDGSKIGKVDDLFVDENDQPEYIGVKLGFLGTRSTLIPMEIATTDETNGAINVSADKETVMELCDWSTLTTSMGMSVELVPRKPIFTPMYSGWSFSSRNRSSTLPIFDPSRS